MSKESYESLESDRHMNEVRLFVLRWFKWGLLIELMCGPRSPRGTARWGVNPCHMQVWEKTEEKQITKICLGNFSELIYNIVLFLYSKFLTILFTKNQIT